MSPADVSAGFCFYARSGLLIRRFHFPAYNQDTVFSSFKICSYRDNLPVLSKTTNNIFSAIQMGLLLYECSLYLYI